MAASSSAPGELSQLFELVATTLPPETHPLVLRHLPVPELARLACVHKALRVAWRSLQEQHPGKRHAPPSAADIKRFKHHSRLERAGRFDDVAVIQSMVAAGVDEHGFPLLRARATCGGRVVDVALRSAAWHGHVQAVELLLAAGANVHILDDHALRWASNMGHTAVVQLLIQHGADVHALDDAPLLLASNNGHTAVVQFLIQHGANVHRCHHYALRRASRNGHTAVVQLLIQHGAVLPSDDDEEEEE